MYAVPHPIDALFAVTQREGRGPPQRERQRFWRRYRAAKHSSLYFIKLCLLWTGSQNIFRRSSDDFARPSATCGALKGKEASSPVACALHHGSDLHSSTSCSPDRSRTIAGKEGRTRTPVEVIPGESASVEPELAHWSVRC